MSFQTNPGTSRPSPGEPVVGRPSPGSQGSPHDSLFRKVFGVPENAAPQLRAVLPPELTARLDLDRLTPVPGTFVDEALKQCHTDVLFSVPLDGEDAFVYTLIEHQSSNDSLMAFRMLRYVVRIWSRHLEENPRARKLPAVIPLVVYNGKGRWSTPRRLQDLIDPAPGGNEAEYLPQFSFLLDDLNVIDPGQLRERHLTPSGLVTMAAFMIVPGNPRAGEDLQEWRGELRMVLDGPGGIETFKAVLSYIVRVGEASPSDLGSLADSLGPDAKEAYMTTAEMLEARGRAEGEVIGEARGTRRMLIQVLTAKFGALPESRSKQVDEASGDQLEKWGTRAATAKTLDEVFE